MYLKIRRQMHGICATILRFVIRLLEDSHKVSWQAKGVFLFPLQGNKSLFHLPDFHSPNIQMKWINIFWVYRFGNLMVARDTHFLGTSSWKIYMNNIVLIQSINWRIFLRQQPITELFMEIKHLLFFALENNNITNVSSGQKCPKDEKFKWIRFKIAIFRAKG